MEKPDFPRVGKVSSKWKERLGLGQVDLVNQKKKKKKKNPALGKSGTSDWPDYVGKIGSNTKGCLDQVRKVHVVKLKICGLLLLPPPLLLVLLLLCVLFVCTSPIRNHHFDYFATIMPYLCASMPPVFRLSFIGRWTQDF